MKKTLLLSFLIFLTCSAFFPHNAFSQSKVIAGIVDDACTLWVAPNGTGNYTSIQPAINAASPGSMICVTQGTYVSTGSTPVIDWRNKDLILLGGYANVNGARDPRLYPSVLDGQSARRVINTQNLSGNSLFSGFVVKNGNDSTSAQGSGMNNLRSSVKIDNVIFQENISLYSGATYGGALMYSGISSDVSIIENSLFEGNRASYGGAIYNNSSAPLIINNTIFRNQVASYSGGAIYNISAALTSIRNSIFSDNYVYFADGGAINNNGGPMDITNCLFYRNWTDFHQALANVIMGNSSAKMTITNSTFSKNGEGLGALYTIYQRDDGHTTIQNSIVFSNRWNGSELGGGFSLYTVRYSDIGGGFIYPGGGNITINPLFIDAFGGNFHLSAGSPCINTGTSAGAPGDDLDGILRPQGAGFDMGAYEYHL